MKTILATALFLFSISANSNPSPNPKMQEMAAVFSQLLPAVLDPKHDLGDKELQALVGRLKGISHELTDQNKILARDPSLQFIAKRLKFELSLINPELLSKESLITKNVILRTLSYCVACHLQEPTRQSQFEKLLPVNPTDWPLRTQARYFTATRSFGKAIIKYEAALGDKKYKQGSPNQWFHDLQRLITIIIEHKKSAALTKEMASFFIDESSSVKFKRILIQWRRASDRWQKEKSFPKTKAQKFAKAKALAELGTKTEKKTKHGGFIDLMRAFHLYRDILQMPPPDQYLTKSFLQAGILGEQLKSTFLFPIHEVYFEACVRQGSGTPIAKDCYQRLKASREQNLQEKNKVPDLLRMPLENLEKVSR